MSCIFAYTCMAHVVLSLISNLFRLKCPGCSRLIALFSNGSGFPKGLSSRCPLCLFQQAFSLLGRRMEVGSADGCLEIKAALVSQPHLRRVFRACGAGSVS